MFEAAWRRQSRARKFAISIGSRRTSRCVPSTGRCSPAREPSPLPVRESSDGSARWAEARGLTIADGHEAAADTVIARIADARALGVEQLTLYAFSTENWARPGEEVRELFAMLARRIAADTQALHAQGVRVQFIGRRDRGGEDLAKQMQLAEMMTAGNTGLRVFVAVDYGGRDEIVKAARRFQGGGEAEFRALLGVPGMEDPDLVIRTSGELRMSNFLLWQAAYSELVFREELWPDFDRCALEESLATYERRQRRFGGRDEAQPSALTGSFGAS
jgi:undecaprenyl diphosphate synthase